MASRADRRLAAIMAADVVGYPRLMETDEAGTLAAIKVLRANVIDPLIAEHHGGQGGGVPLRDAMAVLTAWGALSEIPLSAASEG